MPTYLVTGAAGFIAARVCEMLLEQGHTVVGVDNLNDYYDVRLKHYRLGRLLGAVGDNAEAVSDELRALGSRLADLRSHQLGASTGSALTAQSSSLPLGSGLAANSSLRGGESTEQIVQRFQERASVPRSELPAQSSRLPIGSKLTAQSSQLHNGRFIFYYADIEDLAALDRIFSAHKFDAVFNLAARAGVRYSMENPHVYLSTNTLGTLNVLECMRKHGVKKHVLASTSSLYAGCPMPFTEDQPVNTPLSPYAASKKAAEMFSWTYHQLYQISTTVLRYFTVYGPAGRPDMSIFRFIKWVDEGTSIELLGDGSQTRDFTFVDDIAEGTIAAERWMLNKAAGEGGWDLKCQAKSTQPLAESSYEIFNLGGGQTPLKLQEIIELIGGFLEKRAEIERKPFHIADVLETRADISKAWEILGWKPVKSPTAGINATVAWHVENRDWIRKICL